MALYPLLSFWCDYCNTVTIQSVGGWAPDGSLTITCPNTAGHPAQPTPPPATF